MEYSTIEGWHTENEDGVAFDLDSLLASFYELIDPRKAKGKRYSLVTLFRKVASSIAIPTTLVVLGWVGYRANAAEQPASAITGILVLVALVPSVMFMVGALFARKLPITRESFARVKAELDRRRAAAAAAPVTELDAEPVIGGN